jgi:hypothetical protein
MLRFKNLVATTVLLTMLGTSAQSLHADECCDEPGAAYEQCCETSWVKPALAVGVVAAIAIAVVASQSSGGHGKHDPYSSSSHSHFHSH